MGPRGRHSGTRDRIQREPLPEAAGRHLAGPAEGAPARGRPVAGGLAAAVGHGVRPPKGEVYFPVEGANGELGFYIVSDGSGGSEKVDVIAEVEQHRLSVVKEAEGTPRAITIRETDGLNNYTPTYSPACTTAAPCSGSSR